MKKNLDNTVIINKENLHPSNYNFPSQKKSSHKRLLEKNNSIYTEINKKVRSKNNTESKSMNEKDTPLLNNFLFFPEKSKEPSKELPTETQPSIYDISNHKEITGAKRKTLINWLIEVQKEYKMPENTLSLGVDILDRVIAIYPEMKEGYFQLCGISCLWIANKFESSNPAKLLEMVHICDDTYTEEEIINAELMILKSIEWKIYCPTIYSLTRRYCESIHRHYSTSSTVIQKFSEKNINDKGYNINKDIEKLRHLIHYLNELSLFYPQTLLALFEKSTIAQSCILLALQIFDFSQDDLKEIASSLDINITETILSCHQSFYDRFKKYYASAPNSKTNACYLKFKDPQYSEVSLIPISDHYPELSLSNDQPSTQELKL